MTDYDIKHSPAPLSRRPVSVAGGLIPGGFQ
jgi:hypothetical protein